MDRIGEYRGIVKRILREYAALGAPSIGEAEVETIFDDSSGHYELQYTGWNGSHRIHGSVIHIDIRGDKIWVQHDGTNIPVVEELMRAGIPKQSIVLGFHHPAKRKLTDFALT